MQEYIVFIVIQTLANALGNAIEDGIEYIIRKVVDETGRCITQFVQQIDTDGDGVYDDEIVLHSLEMMIPDFDDGYCIVNEGDSVGIGLPSFDVIDGLLLCDYIDLSDPYAYPTITGNDDGYLLDLDLDGNFDDVLIPLPDLTGDGVDDWGWLTDEDDNGIPDASPDAPYYPVGSDQFNQIVKGAGNTPSFIIVSPDGTMSIYDDSGNLTKEDCDTAYSLWLSENAAMIKPFENYSVSEGLLFLIFVCVGFGFISKLFKRRQY